MIFLIVVVTHNTFTQLNIPTQDLPSWFVKAVNNSISKVIRVMVANRRILFSEVWVGVARRANTKIRRVKVQNDIRMSKQTSPIFNCVTPVSVSLAKYDILPYLDGLCQSRSCKMRNYILYGIHGRERKWW